MKIAHQSRRETFPLATPNKAVAAARAREIYLSLVANGWDVTVAKFKRSRRPARPDIADRPCTVGEFLAGVSKIMTNQRTFKDYAQAFRQIVSDIFGLSNSNLKYDCRTGGREEWLSKIHAISLADLTPGKVQEWKLSFLAKAGDDPITLRKARVSVNAIIRRARSLFSSKKLRHVTLTLPRLLPFEGIEFEARQSMKYRGN